MTARIYRPARTVTQSGKGKLKAGKSKTWLLEFDRETPREIDPLMGWAGSGDMKQQLHLWFDTREDAIAYAERNAVAFRVEEPKESRQRTMSYSDNFKFNRVGPWSH